MNIRDIEKLKIWLLKALQPVCDADPAALSKYIVALLRKEKSRAALKELCINQLEVFLSKETPSFVDKLFTSLESESYLNGGGDDAPLKATPLQNAKTNVEMGMKGSPAPGSGSSTSSTSSQERMVDHRRPSEDSRHREVDDDDRDFRRARYRHETPPVSSSLNDRGRKRKNEVHVDPPKRSIKQRLGPREDDRNSYRRRQHSRSRSRSATPHNVDGGGAGELGEGERGRKRPTNDVTVVGNGDDVKPPNQKRQRCKDYDEKGMCLLGEQCPYDHGNDPVVIAGPLPHYAPPPFPMGLPPPPPNLPPLPPTSGLLLPPIVRPPPLNRTNSPSCADGYNPEEPSLNPPHGLPPHPMIQQVPLRPGFTPIQPSGIPIVASHIPPSLPSSTSVAATSIDTNTTTSGVTIPPPPGHAFKPVPHNAIQGGSGRPLSNRASDTLVLRKVPRELNSITKLSSHFEKFGTIVNLQVRYENDAESAIVQFSSPTEAKAAHDCTEAVLNNRFIRVYYLKNSGGKNQTIETPVSAAVSAIRPDVSNQHSHYKNTQQKAVTSSSTVNTVTTPTTQADSTHGGKTSMTSSSYQQQQQNKRQQQAASVLASSIATQKKLQLQKKYQELMEAQIQQQKLLLKKLENKSISAEEKAAVIKTLKSVSSSIDKLKDILSSATKAVLAKTHNPSTQGKPQPTHATSKTTPSPTTPTPPQSLQQQADQLRTEAQSLGILPQNNEHSDKKANKQFHIGGKPYGQHHHSNDLRSKIDGKPRQLLVMNVEDKDALTQHFESFGSVSQVEVDSDNSNNYIFTFRSRIVAEKAAKTSIFQGKPLIMKWYTPKSPGLPLTTPIMAAPIPAPPMQNSTPTIVRRRTVSIVSDGEADTLLMETPNNTSARSRELSLSDLDLLNDDETPNPPIRVVTPNQSKPRVVHLVEDDEEDEFDERSWRR